VGSQQEAEIISAEYGHGRQVRLYGRYVRCGSTGPCFHADNAYFLPERGDQRLSRQTHTVSNTAFRVLADQKAVLLPKPYIEKLPVRSVKTLDVRKLNCYREGKTKTPYGQNV